MPEDVSQPTNSIDSRHRPAIEFVNIEPSELTEQHQHIVQQFLQIYTQLNQQSVYEKTHSTNITTRDQLQAIERLLVQRDTLEDQYAPLGIMVEPIYKDSVAVTLEITIGRLNPATQQPRFWTSTSATTYMDIN